MIGLTSAAGLVGFLSEPDTDLRVFALRRLNEDIGLLWTEVAASLDQIEALYEDESFPERELAALVAAKVYYHLQEYNESMVFALGAGKLFDIDTEGEFEDTTITKCVDTYIALSVLHSSSAPVNAANQPPPQLISALLQNGAGNSTASASLTSTTTPFSQSVLPSKSLLSREEGSTQFDPTRPSGGNASVPGAHPAPLALSQATQKSLQEVIRRLFEKCFKEGAYRQVVGIAVEARNLDVLREAILRAGQDSRKGKKLGQDGGNKSEELMDYILDICMNIVQERGLRNAILGLVLGLLNEIQNPDYFSIAKCVVYLNQHSMASEMLRKLIERNDSHSRAVAYQVAFDLYDNGTQEFLLKAIEGIPGAERQEERPTMNGDTRHPNPDNEATESDQLLSELESRSGAPVTSELTSRLKDTPASEDQEKAFASIRQILQGSKSIELNLEFLFRNNRTDKSILNKIRDSLEARNSIFHTSVTFANAFMNAGTTNDTFFRENLEWLGKAVNWSKFTATAALGVIHKGNIGQGQKLLEPYLPRENSVGTGSAYSQGGSLYALGLIYTNHGTHVLDYLRTQFRNETADEVVKHGGALGLGVAGMATADTGIYEELKTVLYTDSAINGEAVGVAMGLVMLGSGNIGAFEDMLTYAHETQHEKIIRGIALGMALIMYGRQEAADELINGLLDDPDPVLRYGGIQTIALAYCGTSSNKAVRKLLHVAVSDVSDDVRRVAVMSLGFVLFKKPGSVPRMVELLSESYNPHVRYGATMALGIACAGTGLDEAIDLLEPMMKDSTDFVRQGALISLSMIMVQQNETMNPKIAAIRKTLQKTMGDRHEDAVAKFGCALSLGILDAGGRNCTIGLQTQSGNLNMAAIVGMAVFTQYWYWFPFTHFLSLAMTPTSIIGVDQDLEIPSFKMHCATRPSLFDYPPEQVVKAEEAPEKVKTAVLSTTAQARRRRMAKERQANRESMEVDQVPITPKVSATEATGDKMETDEDGKNNGKPEVDGENKHGAAGDEKSRKKAEKEKVGYEIENMSRVLPAQLKYISFPGERYQPVKKPTGGVILVYDAQSSTPKTLIEMKSKKTATRAAPDTNAANASVANPLAGLSQLPGISRGRTGTQTTASTDNEPPRRTSSNGGGGGAAAAAAVLNAVDEGEEGDEDAEVPGEFEYESDGQSGDH